MQYIYMKVKSHWFVVKTIPKKQLQTHSLGYSRIASSTWILDIQLSLQDLASSICIGMIELGRSQQPSSPKALSPTLLVPEQ